jgi:hypothetical protein
MNPTTPLQDIQGLYIAAVARLQGVIAGDRPVDWE